MCVVGGSGGWGEFGGGRMKRLLLDTNIYGELAFDGQSTAVREKILEKVIVHGFRPVREELRAVSRRVLLERRSLRIALLHIYDEIIKKEYPLTSEITDLAEVYYKKYRELGGSCAHDKMFTDFSVVACATLHQIDIVVSEDNRTMLVQHSLDAYNEINSSRMVRTPQFIGYLEFKRWLSE